MSKGRELLDGLVKDIASAQSKFESEPSLQNGMVVVVTAFAGLLLSLADSAVTIAENKHEEFLLFEKQVLLLENICRALEHSNEQQFHSVR